MPVSGLQSLVSLPKLINGNGLVMTPRHPRMGKAPHYLQGRKEGDRASILNGLSKDRNMFRYLTAGESHGKGLTVIVEGVPARDGIEDAVDPIRYVAVEADDLPGEDAAIAKRQVPANRQIEIGTLLRLQIGIAPRAARIDTV